MELILDVQGFRGPFNRFIVKELAIINASESGHQALECILFAPPYPWSKLPVKYRSMNAWLTRNFHGIPWDSGDTPYEDLVKVIERITKDATTVYVKGRLKKEWVQELTDTSVVNLEDLDCPALNHLYLTSCWNHNFEDNKRRPEYTCALQNVKTLKAWYLKECVPCLHRSLKIFCNQGSIKDMAAQDIVHFPKQFIVKFAANFIDDIWNKLPQELRNDQDVQSYRRCYGHHHSEASQSYDDIGSPVYPMIKTVLRVKC